ncbi:hypothetical protein KI387_017208, partial [Taxus chinensis]
MDSLEDHAKELDTVVETINIKGEGLTFNEVSTFVGNICTKTQNEVSAWNTLEADLQ